MVSSATTWFRAECEKILDSVPNNEFKIPPGTPDPRVRDNWIELGRSEQIVINPGPKTPNSTLVKLEVSASVPNTTDVTIDENLKQYLQSKVQNFELPNNFTGAVPAHSQTVDLADRNICFKFFYMGPTGAFLNQNPIVEGFAP